MGHYCQFRQKDKYLEIKFQWDTAASSGKKTKATVADSHLPVELSLSCRSATHTIHLHYHPMQLTVLSVSYIKQLNKRCLHFNPMQLTVLSVSYIKQLNKQGLHYNPRQLTILSASYIKQLNKPCLHFNPRQLTIISVNYIK